MCCWNGVPIRNYKQKSARPIPPNETLDRHVEAFPKLTLEDLDSILEGIVKVLCLYHFLLTTFTSFGSHGTTAHDSKRKPDESSRIFAPRTSFL
jgi:hypothetical protein